ncbi:F-box/LRR-repeat protein 7 [Phytophthora citrophthora]|uniref:F-box/LRR-repeat protein 7 n=1 Tax=Phytophthora citrophthora TaxID=4793 RepID=A0AAD9LSY1_9STRA|nr:F-box/LRR-repeat protein 7 [Phytophthora citrophthora]
MAGKKRPPLPILDSAGQQHGSSEDDDDVPLAKILQRRRLSAKASPKQKNGVGSATGLRLLLLSEVSERCIMMFLPVVPDRLRVEAVCKRWLRLSREELPVTELDFGRVPVQPSLRRDVSVMLERANQHLTRLILPDITLVDAHVDLIVQQQKLCVFRAHRMQKKHIFNIVQRCPELKTLELLDCRALTLSKWPRDAVALREIFFNGCNFMTNQAATALIRACGSTLEKIIFTDATSLDSRVFRDLARYTVKLEELTISNCSSVNLRDLQVLSEALWESLRRLDLSSCRGISSFPRSTKLPRLQVLILDKTKINDEGLRGISEVAPSLRYLSLQDCRSISDDGVAAISGCTNLELIDLKGTPVTDASLHALEAQCPRLHLVRVDSCRSISRKMRSKYNERVHRILATGSLSKWDKLFAERKKIEMIDPNKSSSDSDESGSDNNAEDYAIEVRRRGASYRRRR